MCMGVCLYVYVVRGNVFVYRWVCVICVWVCVYVYVLEILVYWCVSMCVWMCVPLCMGEGV
jgi:hypothetical protein